MVALASRLHIRIVELRPWEGSSQSLIIRGSTQREQRGLRALVPSGSQVDCSLFHPPTTTTSAHAGRLSHVLAQQVEETMHVREQLELAALLATHGPSIIHAVDTLSDKGIEQYWTSCKCRMDRWSYSLRKYSTDIQQGRNSERVDLWQCVRPVIEEILLSEVLTRVWTAVSAAHDGMRGASESEPIARSVLVGHLEARHRALNLMVYGQGFGMADAVALNRIRRRCERWCDLLLAPMMKEHDVRDLGFDKQRVEEFARDMRSEHIDGHGSLSWQLLLASLRTSFQRGITGITANGDLNARIASGILTCFPGEFFDSTGLFKSFWLIRMGTTASDAEGMLADILESDSRPSPRFLLPADDAINPPTRRF